MTINRKKDLLDGILFYAAKGSDPTQFLDYPEQVLFTLRLFYSVWRVPEYLVPSKRSKSKFEQWINELTELENICPSQKKMEAAMKMTLDKYKEKKLTYPILHPLSIKALLAESVSEINRNAVVDDLPEQIEVADKDKLKKGIKGIKSFIEE
jgi:hypothetical protein